MLLKITCHTNIVSRARVSVPGGKQRERAKVQGLASAQSLPQSLPPGRYWGVVLPSSPGGEYDSPKKRLRCNADFLWLHTSRNVFFFFCGGMEGGGGGGGVTSRAKEPLRRRLEAI